MYYFSMVRGDEKNKKYFYKYFEICTCIYSTCFILKLIQLYLPS